MCLNAPRAELFCPKAPHYSEKTDFQAVLTCENFQLTRGMGYFNWILSIFKGHHGIKFPNTVINY